MLRLPSFSVAGQSWQLPLCSTTALQLVEAVLVTAESERQALFEDALREDPPFALWTVSVASTHGRSSLNSIGKLASWLTHHALTVLQWSDDELAQVPLDVALVVQRWAKMAARGVASARAIQAPKNQKKEFSEQAYLVTLLADAANWLENCLVKDSGDGAPVDLSFLPAWLLESCSGSEDHQAPLDRAPQDVDHSDDIYQRWTNGSLHKNLRGGRCLPQLTRRLARLGDLEKEFDSILQHEKLFAMKELAYGAGHEINNPLANISSRAQTLLHEETDPERRRKLATINAQAFRAYEMISNMMLFARPAQIHCQQVDLTALVSKVVEELSPTAAEQGTAIDWLAEEKPIEAFVDPEQIAVALAALLDNSLEAIAYGGKIEVAVRQAPADSNDQVFAYAEIVVSDSGPGIDPQQQSHLLDPFYSGREAGRGLGFGLSKCWRIVTLHGGTIHVQSESEQGASFTIRLPNCNVRLRQAS